MILDPLSESVLLMIHQGRTIREMMPTLGLRSTNAIAERINVLEGGGFVLPPSRKGGTDRRLSQFGLDYMKAQGYLK